jgi:molecular chaperone GrpE
LAESKPAVAEQESLSARKTEPLPRQGLPRETTPPQIQQEDELREELEEWRDRALRLQAEIENFRKRQQRLAEDRVETNRARLLRGFLTIADDLERALNVETGDNESLRAGVEVTYRSLKQLLRQEGVERVEAKGETFDPTLHEAVATVPHHEVGVDQDVIVEVAEPGYRLDSRLLRPARVVVAT